GSGLLACMTPPIIVPIEPPFSRPTSGKRLSIRLVAPAAELVQRGALKEPPDGRQAPRTAERFAVIAENTPPIPGLRGGGFPCPSPHWSRRGAWERHCCE